MTLRRPSRPHGPYPRSGSKIARDAAGSSPIPLPAPVIEASPAPSSASIERAWIEFKAQGLGGDGLADRSHKMSVRRFFEVETRE